MTTARERLGEFWRDGAARARLARFAYHGLLPWLVATLPVTLSAVAAVGAGWRAADSLPLSPLPGLLVGLLWARQVLVAADDDLGRQVDLGVVEAEAARRLGLGLSAAVWLTVLLLPATLEPLRNRAEQLRFQRSAAAARNGLTAALAERGEAWAAACPPGKALEPDDPRCAPENFGGPFASGPATVIGKLGRDAAGRWFYILDRPRRPGPGLVAWRRQLKLWTGHSAETAGGLWLYERGLVRGEEGRMPPATTIWGLPLRRATPVGEGWWWYIAGEAERE